jgi:HEAT repeat protein
MGFIRKHWIGSCLLMGVIGLGLGYWSQKRQIHFSESSRLSQSQSQSQSQFEKEPQGKLRFLPKSLQSLSFKVRASSDSEREKQIQEQEWGAWTEKELWWRFHQASQSRDPNAMEALYLKFKAYLFLYPEKSSQLAKILEVADPRSKTMQVLATALSAVGHPEAQAALIAVLKFREDDFLAARVLVPALGLTQHPTEESEAALKSLIRRSQNEDIVTTAGLSLGIMASHLGQDAPERQKQIVTEIQNDYENAATSQQKKFLLSVLGNAGSKEALPLIIRAIQSDDLSIQSEAVLALRFISGAEVDSLLLNLLIGAENNQIRKSAAFALGEHEASKQMSEKMRNTFFRQKSEEVRREIIKSVYQHRSVDLEIPNWLKKVQESDASSEIQQLAKSYLGLLTPSRAE